MVITLAFIADSASVLAASLCVFVIMHCTLKPSAVIEGKWVPALLNCSSHFIMYACHYQAESPPTPPHPLQFAIGMTQIRMRFCSPSVNEKKADLSTLRLRSLKAHACAQNRSSQSRYGVNRLCSTCVTFSNRPSSSSEATKYCRENSMLISPKRVRQMTQGSKTCFRESPIALVSISVLGCRNWTAAPKRH